MKYLIKTYGCQMNAHESEKISGALTEMNFCKTENESDADIIIFNTCCIRDSAEQKIIGNIGATKKLKKMNPNLIIVIAGCMTQQNDAAIKIKQKFPFIDIIIGTKNLTKIPLLIQDVIDNHNKTVEIEKMDNLDDFSCKYDRLDNNHAFVNIMYGCNNFCSYCIVPYVRGRERSRNSMEIYNEVKVLINQGYKQITLLGQNVNSYGQDTERELSFPELLRLLTSIEGDFKIKFMTSHPKDFSKELADEIINNNKIAKCLHLPVQSGNDEVLKNMNRNYTVDSYLKNINYIKNLLPEIGITTDIIVGFPGETEAQFLDTLALLDKVQYSGVFAFMYSKRSGTVAEKMDNQISNEEKHRRINILLAKQKQINKNYLQKLINKSFNAWIESENTAILDSGVTVNIANGKNKEKTYQLIKVEKIEKNKLYGLIL